MNVEIENKYNSVGICLKKASHQGFSVWAVDDNMYTRNKGKDIL